MFVCNHFELLFSLHHHDCPAKDGMGKTEVAFTLQFHVVLRVLRMTEEFKNSFVASGQFETICLRSRSDVNCE